MEIVIFLIVIFAITKIFNPKIKKINKELKAKKDDYYTHFLQTECHRYL